MSYLIKKNTTIVTAGLKKIKKIHILPADIEKSVSDSVFTLYINYLINVYEATQLKDTSIKYTDEKY